MVMEVKKQKRRRKKNAPFYDTLLEKSLAPSKNRLTEILNRKKFKTIQGFEPGLLGQDAIALPLAPPSLPIPPVVNHFNETGLFDP